LQAEISDKWSISFTMVPMKPPQTTPYQTPFVDNLPRTVSMYFYYLHQHMHNTLTIISLS